jgi:hypothetical protein
MVVSFQDGFGRHCTIRLGNTQEAGNAQSGGSATQLVELRRFVFALSRPAQAASETMLI